MFLFSGNPFGEFESQVADATSEFIPGAKEDLTQSLDICDVIKSRKVPARDALRIMRERFGHPNPNVHLLTLQLLDTATKNAGRQFLAEMASRDFCEVMQALCGHVPQTIHGASTGLDLLPDSVHPEVRAQSRQCLQRWALLLEAVDPVNLSFMKEAMLECQRAGVQFPPAPASIALDVALVDTNAPPEWVDSPHCVRCRTDFSFSVRMHHCRRCGRAFCQACSARELSLPEIGLPEPVRVCEPCYVDRTSGQIKREPPSTVKLPGHNRSILSAPSGETVDADMAEAIKQSLLEDQLRQARRDKVSSEEEAMLAAAVAASLTNSANAASSSTTTSNRRPVEGITDKDKATMDVFGELIADLEQLGSLPGARSDDLTIDNGLQATAGDMRSLQQRLQRAVRDGMAAPGAIDILATLQRHLDAYDRIVAKAATMRKREQLEEESKKRDDEQRKQEEEAQRKRDEQKRREDEQKMKQDDGQDSTKRQEGRTDAPIQFPPLPACNTLRPVGSDKVDAVRERIQRLKKQQTEESQAQEDEGQPAENLSAA